MKRVHVKRDNDIFETYDVTEESANKFYHSLISPHTQNAFIDLALLEDEVAIFNKMSIKHVFITDLSETTTLKKRG